MTSKLAVSVLPVPPFADETVTELFFNPTVDPVTGTLKLQLLPAVNDPPESTIVS